MFAAPRAGFVQRQVELNLVCTLTCSCVFTAVFTHNNHHELKFVVALNLAISSAVGGGRSFLMGAYTSGSSNNGALSCGPTQMPSDVTRDSLGDVSRIAGNVDGVNGGCTHAVMNHSVTLDGIASLFIASDNKHIPVIQQCNQDDEPSNNRKVLTKRCLDSEMSRISESFGQCSVIQSQCTL